ncbi:hypothetical protein RLPCCGM1_c2781 [Rhizobium leguminosarum bv. phaseoli CCGM1]|nr:hypothetical protein RLPCCGM1_c2781 [Rhizobium leguminosarum bv. phaseoli CCGM1]
MNQIARAMALIPYSLAATYLLKKFRQPGLIVVAEFWPMQGGSQE